MSPAIAAIGKRTQARMRKMLGDERARRTRARAFRAVQRVRGLPLLRPNLCVALADGSCMIGGTLVDPGNRIERIELMRDGQEPQDITERVHRFSGEGPSLYRTMVDDGDPIRFAAVLPAAADGSGARPRAIAFVLKSGRRTLRRLPPLSAAPQPLDTIRRILSSIPTRFPEKRRMFDLVYGPAIAGLWAGRQRDDCDVDALDHNPELASESPEVSLIIPIYGRYDFIEHQVSQFVDDPDMRRHEIIFVIDDPRLDEEVRASCATLARSYPLAFRVLHLSRNLGYAGANNVGVRHARGRHVLLLNSDVMPKGAGWLREMIEAAGERLATSIVGARLVYEDESVQHDGMRFYDSPFMNRLWTNVHPGKGLPLGVFPSRAGVTERQSVTGACMLMARDVYDRIGGLDESYILGDFEDSDLCLAARREGIDIVLAESVVLYHLERQSQSLVSSDRWKEELTYYNCWHHTVKWDADIRQLLTGSPS